MTISAVEIFRAGLRAAALIVAAGAAIVSLDAAAWAQSSPGDIFLKMLPVLQHPRCSNCHGRLDVFRDGTPHPGGKQENGEDCANCHNAGWKNQTESRWAGGSASEICDSILASRMLAGPASFLSHVKDDPIVKMAFEGKRGFDDLQPDPPPMSLDQFIALATQWVEAMGATNSWPSDDVACPGAAYCCIYGENMSSCETLTWPACTSKPHWSGADPNLHHQCIRKDAGLWSCGNPVYSK
jgi:hypothetical protein